MTIGLLIVGDADLRLALGEQFARVVAIAVEEAEAAREAIARIESGPPDVLLIADDVEAPGAATLLQMARAAGFDGPAILLARFEAATPEGFDGAMRRPMRFAALMAMIRAKIAPTVAAASAALGDQLFCETTQTLMGPDGVTRLLTEKETAILARLTRARGGVVARDVLLREIWGYSPAVDTHTLETHIHRLRRKLEDASGRPKLLLSAPSGYRLTTNDASLDDGA